MFKGVNIGVVTYGDDGDCGRIASSIVTASIIATSVVAAPIVAPSVVAPSVVTTSVISVVATRKYVIVVVSSAARSSKCSCAYRKKPLKPLVQERLEYYR